MVFGGLRGEYVGYIDIAVVGCGWGGGFDGSEWGCEVIFCGAFAVIDYEAVLFHWGGRGIDNERRAG